MAKRKAKTIQRLKDKEQQYSDQKIKNNNIATKRQRTTIQRPKDKNNNISTKRQRTTIQRPKDKEKQYNE